MLYHIHHVCLLLRGDAARDDDFALVGHLEEGLFDGIVAVDDYEGSTGDHEGQFVLTWMVRYHADAVQALKKLIL